MSELPLSAPSQKFGDQDMLTDATSWLFVRFMHVVQRTRIKCLQSRGYLKTKQLVSVFTFVFVLPNKRDFLWVTVDNMRDYKQTLSR
jgi:hypothetical protein